MQRAKIYHDITFADNDDNKYAVDVKSTYSRIRNIQ